MSVGRFIDCTVLVTATKNRGVLGKKVISRETFRLSARSENEARQLAGANMRSKGFPGEPGSISVSTEVKASLPVFWGDVEAARRKETQGAILQA